MKTKLMGQWRLRYGLLLAGLEGLTVVLVADGDPRVQLFDSRDNREAKRQFYSILMGCKFEVEDCEVTL